MVVDLKEEDLKTLHSNAKDLFDSYIKKGAINFIQFDEEIIRDISNIISQGHKEIQKLRTSPPLFRAYEQVYNNLEDNLCPQFHTSDEVSKIVLLLLQSLVPTFQYLKLVLGRRLVDCRPDVRIKDDQNQK